MPPGSALIGVVSDTHGLIRPEALAALRGCELILHAGDIGALEVVEQLRELAPVRAVRGNVDRGAWAEAFPERDLVEVAGRRLLVLHDVGRLGEAPRAEEVDAVVSGHSHAPRSARRDGVLYLNPGSAGPRRFRLPVAVARLRLEPDALEAEIVRLS